MNGQDTYLTAISTFLARVLETSKLSELINDRKLTKDFKQLFTKTMSDTLNMVTMEGVYKDAKEMFEERHTDSYAHVKLFIR